MKLKTKILLKNIHQFTIAHCHAWQFILERFKYFQNSINFFKESGFEMVSLTIDNGLGFNDFVVY